MKREIPVLISLSVALSAFCTPIRSFAAVSPAQSAEVRERNNRAALLQKRHIFAQAVEEYNKCLEIDPDEPSGASQFSPRPDRLG